MKYEFEIVPGKRDIEIVIRGDADIIKENMPSIMEMISTDTKIQLINIETNEIELVKLKDILFFDYFKNSTYVYTKKNEYKIKSTLKEIEEKYKNKFQRINVSQIVCLGAVKKILQLEYSRIEIEIEDDTRLIVNRNYKKEFMDKIKEMYRNEYK